MTSVRPSGSIPASTPHVLVLDDNDQILRAWARCARSRRVALDVARCTQEAEAALASHPVTRLIADYRLRGETAARFLEAVARTHPELEIIVVTGDDSGVAAELRGLGVTAEVVLKPAPLADLLCRPPLPTARMSALTRSVA